MILYQSDWELYPSAIAHTNTANRSFVKLAALYKEMGVENHAFLLALVQPELEHVDPYDENLDMETMAKIQYECTVNPWYFFREIAMAPALAGTTINHFQANRGNIAALWLYFNHITYVLIQPRQTGKSYSIDTLMVYLMNIGSVNTDINMITRSDGLRDKNLARLKAIQEELPYYLSMRRKNDVFNTEEIKIGAINNTYKGHLSNSSPKLAEGVGRGFTSPTAHFDEAAYISNIDRALPAALMAGNRARDEAKANNAHYGTIITTTAGKIDDRDGNYVYGLISNATIWDEKFFDAKDNRNLYELIMRNSTCTNEAQRRPIVNLTFSHRQLGYTDEWMKGKIEETIADAGDADRDLFNRWTSGSLSSPIKDYVELLRNSVRENYRTEIYAPYNCILRWYISKEDIQDRIAAGHSFIAGVDTSDAVGRDDVTLVVRDHINAEIIMVATFNELNLITLADFFVSLLVKYLNMTMIIERRSSAAAIIDYILMKLPTYGINPFKRLFSQVVQKAQEMEKDFEIVKKSTYYNADIFIKYKQHFGFTTSFTGNTSRSELYSTTLISCCKYTGRYTYDQQLVNQMLALVIKNNRVDHPSGGHDDLVIASLLSYWLISLGRNLNFYGIDTSMLLKHNEDYLTEKYSNTTLDREEMLIIEEEFNELIEKYKNEKSVYIAMKLVLKIKKLASQLNNQYNQAISVEQMLEEINRNNKIKSRY